MSANSNKTRSTSLCQFPFSDGRRCALPLSPYHPHFCLTHALRERRLLDAEQVAAELTAMATQIRTFNDLNHFLTRLAYYTAAQRIPKSTARTLAYLASLIRQTLPPVRQEVLNTFGLAEWDEILRTTVRDSSGATYYTESPSADASPAEPDLPGASPRPMEPP
jgi:hypothetical protein